MTIQDWAAQRCTISYRAPELFNVESHCIIDERTDIWVKPCILHPLRLVYFVQFVFLSVLLLLFCLPILLQSLGCVLYCMMMLEGPYDMVFQKGDSVALAVQNPVAIPQSCRLVFTLRFHQVRLHDSVYAICFCSVLHATENPTRHHSEAERFAWLILLNCSDSGIFP